MFHTADMTNFTVDSEEQLARCKGYQQYWKDLNSSSETTVLPSVEDAMQWIDSYGERSGTHVQVLVCGSLHLVGVVMATLKLTVDNL